MSKAEIEFAAENAQKLNDLISRSAMWTDIQMLPHNGDMISSEEVEQAINEAPAVDAEKVFEVVGMVKEAFEMAKADLAPVVRCKDCRYATWAIWAQRYNCEKVRGLMTADNHFCAWGKRREDHE